MRGHSGGHAADLLVTALQARTALDTEVKVLREPPSEPTDIKSDTGVWDAIFIGRQGRQDVDDIDVDIPAFKATPIMWDEHYTLWVTIQCLRNDTAGTQKVATDRAIELLGELIGTIATAPGLGFVDTTDLSTFWCEGITGLLRTGALDAGHAAGFEVGLRFRCRLHLS